MYCDNSIGSINIKTFLRIEVMAGLDQIRSLKQEIKEQKDEEKRLHKTILVGRLIYLQ